MAKKKIKDLTLGEYFKIQNKCCEYYHCEGCPLKEIPCSIHELEFCQEEEVEVEQ